MDDDENATRYIPSYCSIPILALRFIVHRNRMQVLKDTFHVREIDPVLLQI
jgi:hypothetical protein